MKFLKHFKSRVLESNDLLKFMWKSKLWFMIPFLLILLIFAAILIFAQTTGVAPFIYTLF